MHQKRFIVIKDIIRVENGESWAQVSPHNGFKVTLEIDFEHKKIKESGQKLTIDFAEQSYLKEISRARTFGYERDVEMLHYRLVDLALGAKLLTMQLLFQMMTSLMKMGCDTITNL